MIELGLALLIIGDWFFTNRENINFALQCAQNKYLRRNELK